MDKLKCLSFFKCRGKEVGVWELWGVWRTWEGKTEGEASLCFWFLQLFLVFHFSV